MAILHEYLVECYQYLGGLIPWNSTKLAKAVPIGQHECLFEDGKQARYQPNFRVLAYFVYIAGDLSLHVSNL